MQPESAALLWDVHTAATRIDGFIVDLDVAIPRTSYVDPRSNVNVKSLARPSRTSGTRTRRPPIKSPILRVSSGCETSWLTVTPWSMTQWCGLLRRSAFQNC